MKVVVQIPIKHKSSKRVKNKNFRILSGKKLAYWLLDEVVETVPKSWDLFIDSEHEEVMDQIVNRYDEDTFRFHKRDVWYASDEANGNHLLNQFGQAHPHYNLYVQLFVTAVTLPGSVIVEAVNKLQEKIEKNDSIFLVTEETGWIWHEGKPINYAHHLPNGLPRSQDAKYLKETTGLYAISKNALLKTSCRIGESPILYTVPKKYALDIDTLEDLEEAEYVLKNENYS